MLSTIVRFVVSALVLLFVSWITPGVVVYGFLAALFASVIIAALGWVVQAVLGRGVAPTSRGLASFVAAAAVIWLTGELFPELLRVTWWGAALAAFIIGLVDAVVPTELR